MAWPIPDIPIFPVATRPHYWRWAGLLLVMIAVASAITLFLLEKQATHDQWFWFYSLLLPCCIWLIVFGLRLNDYQQSMAANHGWEKATEQTIFEWQEWSRQQLPVLAQAILTPDNTGIKALLADAENKPLFPQKVRPLALRHDLVDYPQEQTHHFLIEIDRLLEQSYPNYRSGLAAIYISSRLSKDQQLVEQLYQLWDMYPIDMGSYLELVESLFNQPPEQPILILTSQHWGNGAKADYTELISAQLVGSFEFVTRYNPPVLGWMGRLMRSTPSTIKQDVEQFFSFNRYPAGLLTDVWLSGLDKNSMAQLYGLPILINLEEPFHLIDFAFAKPGPEIASLLPAIASQALSIKTSPQLCLCQQQDAIFIQLFTLVKFT